jgi:hypothetical protein
VILGVVLGLAVDRWVSSIDDRARAEQWAERLSSDILADSANMVATLETFGRYSDFGVTALELMAGPRREIEDPNDFIRLIETMGWWIPFEAARETWDEILATGQLGLFRDPAVRGALTRYYEQLDQIAAIEARWVSTMNHYWILNQAAIPPLVRIGVLDAAILGKGGYQATQDQAQNVVEVFRRDPALRGAFGRVVQTFRYGAGPMSALFPAAAEARRALEDF